MNRPIMTKKAVARLKLDIHHLTPRNHTLYVLGAKRVTPARQQTKLVRPFDNLMRCEI
jgi:hypothetical protein